MTIRRGSLIVFEGGDRCGKTTQVELLYQHLLSINVPTTILKFPQRTSPSGILLNSYLQSTTSTSAMDIRAIHLLFSANRWEAMNELKIGIEEGMTFIIDRYAYSGVAYTHSQDIPMEWCKGPDRGLMKPDLVIYMDLDPKIAATRGDYGLERYENIQMQEKVYNSFKKLRDESWICVDASKPIDELQKTISNHVYKISNLDKPPVSFDLWNN